MPIILWRHLLIELCKTLLVTTAIIVSVIAFGAAIKPLADNLIGAEVVLKYVTLATIPMLQFALPFSAGFAVTIVMHRFVTDNEVMAMAASGMSYRRVLLPVAALGVALSIVMLVLVTLIAPLFLTRMKVMATADATQMLVGAVRRGEALVADNLLIYADGVEQVDVAPGSEAQRRLVLKGVAAIELGKRGAAEPATEFTAEAAAIDVYSTPSGTVAKIALRNATVYRPAEGAIASVPYAEPEAIAFDRAFYRGPKFLTVPEILALKGDVDQAAIVRAPKARLASVLGELELWNCVVAQVASEGAFVLKQRVGDRSFRVEGCKLEGGAAVPATAGGRVRITEQVNGVATRRTETERAVLTPISETGFLPSFNLVVTAPLETRDVSNRSLARWPPRVFDLVPQPCDPRAWEMVPSDQLVSQARAMPEADARIPLEALRVRSAQGIADVEKQRAFVLSESDSHLLQRAAQSVSVVLVVCLGAVLALWLRSALPLTIYLLSFLPAVANIMLIAGGQQLVKDGLLAMGSAVMWSGNALLLAVLLWSWGKLVRN